MTTFKDLGLSDEVLIVLVELGFDNPSKIQKQAIPHLISGDTDFIGLAQTGTGKTAAFGIPLLERIDPSKNATQALVLAPTRELGQQTAEQLHKFSKYLNKINVLAVYGGAAIAKQIKALRKTQHIIIATPGRLIDLIKRKSVKLDQLSFLVLDEADEMLNMGFKEDLDKILSYAPESKLTWLFSATMPDQIKRIVKKYMHKPVEVRVDSRDEVNTNIIHQYVTVKHADKIEGLTRFFDINPDMRAIVFCRTKKDTQSLAENLLKRNYKADALHGDLTQGQRDRVMKRFKTRHLHILIATDVAARGIDVDDLTHIFHFTLPDDDLYYTHRSGRTARAGKKGISIAFINGREQYRINRLEKQLGISFKRVLIPMSEDITDENIQNWCAEILAKKTKGKIDPKLLEKANMLFANLSKEELTAKVLMHEIERINLSTSTKDLNDAPSKSKKGTGHGSFRDEKRRGPAPSLSKGKRKHGRKFKKKGKKPFFAKSRSKNRRHS